MKFKKILLYSFIYFLSSCVSPTKSESSLQPLIIDDFSVTTNEDTSIDITLQKYRTDGTNLTYTIVVDAAMGTTSVNGNIITYLPTENYNGTDTFTYKANDGSNDSNVSTVMITISMVNDNPTVQDINDLSVTINQSIDVILAGSDIENDNLTFSIVDNPSNGTASIEGNIARFTATNLGTDSFTYKANDGLLDSEVPLFTTVTITVTPDNDAPVLELIEDFSFNEDESITITPTTFDADFDDLTYQVPLWQNLFYFYIHCMKYLYNFLYNQNFLIIPFYQ